MDSNPRDNEPPLPIILDGDIIADIIGLGYDLSVPPALWAVKNTDTIKKLHAAYTASGASVINTLTDGASPAILEKYGEQEHIGEINRRLAMCAKEAGARIVAGKLTASEVMIEPYGDVSFSKLIDIYREQAEALSECDYYAIECALTLWDMRAAVLACKRFKKPITVVLNVDDEGMTDAGCNFVSALIILQELGIAAFGISGLSPRLCAELLKGASQYANIPLIARPDAVYTDEDGNTVSLSESEYAAQCRELIAVGVKLIGGGRGAGARHIAALCEAVKGIAVPQIQKDEDDALVFASEDMIFFLDPETTEFSPAIECSPDMADLINQLCEENYDVLTVAINSPDDAIDFAKNMHMATLPVSFLSDDEISLKMALMLYQGKAIVDVKSLIDPERLKHIAEKYGAVIY